MQLRYRYRIDPTPGQQEALARTFGCARVVWNDALATRRVRREAGERWLKTGDLMRVLITDAKRTPERAWLSNAPVGVLQQSLRDQDKAWSRYFEALKARKAWQQAGRKGPKPRRVGRPRPKRRKAEQAARYTRSDRWKITDASRLRLPKVGDVAVRWSRDLPAEPSSVTVILDCSGRYHASFVVDVPDEPLPVTGHEVGVDLGLTSFIATSDGEHVPAPKHLRRAERHLGKAQRRMHRRQKGSANRRKAKRRVARMHARVADRRRDFLHKLSTRLIRENQAVYVEDLCVEGLARTRLAKSVHDAGWSMFTNMLVYKAQRHHRVFAKINRWYPSSQLCSACGVSDGKKPLSVRSWMCAGCGAAHDRDVNAAKNILAAGRAERRNACGADVRPLARAAVGVEAGTHRGAA